MGAEGGVEKGLLPSENILYVVEGGQGRDNVRDEVRWGNHWLQDF